MLIICGYVKINPSDLSLFMADMKVLAQTVRKRAGNLSYDVAVEDHLAGSVLISERWKDQDALTAHLAAPHTRAFITRWQQRMTAEILKYDALNERGLLDRE
ncbi:putative quinol monooxygenase [Kosakonia sp. SOY2]|uniref:putative quinol monooxygenase n=1 Tax=Kosakonia sp. SOY2 TaxID=3014557 RepID=UPI0022ABFDAD|nr:putative quinol monooxygenase [Kosakonia sp. SOY2]MCZ3382300.1 putative quinol monooxygenase [Kosakonia sp. SOY2]